MQCIRSLQRSCNQLHDTARLLDLALGVFAEVPRLDDDGELGQTAFAEHFAVAEREEVEDGCGAFRAACEVLLALFLWDERPELRGHTYQQTIREVAANLCQNE